MHGKEKCRILKEIRRQIAAENDLTYATSECTHRGDCRGTCPRCEAELRELERQIEAKRALGKRVTVAALCAGLVVSGTACTRPSPTELSFGGLDAPPLIDQLDGAMVEPLAGEATYPEPELAGDVYFPESEPEDGEIDDAPGA